MKFRAWLNTKLFHFLGTVQEPWYTWLNALANAWILFRNPEKVTHPGTLHPDKTFYVINNLAPYVGVAGWYDYVLGCMLYAKKRGWIPVVYPTPPAQKDDGDWYAFFKGVSPYTVEEAMNSRNVVFAVSRGMIHKRYNRRNIELRHALTREIQLSDELSSFVEKKIGDLFESCEKPMVAIRYRGTDYRYATGHAKVPDLESFCDTVECDMRKWDVDIGEGEHMFVVTEEQEALNGIKRRFPKCRYVEKERFSNNEKGRYLCYRRLPTLTPKMNNFLYMLEIYALAKCDYLIGGVNGGVLMALNLNGNRYSGVHVMNTGAN